jgi:hypothetical protein
LAFWDIPNYANQTRPAELQYLSIPLHHILRNPVSAVDNLATGGLLFALTLVGLIFGAITLLRHPSSKTTSLPPRVRRAIALLLVWTVLTVGTLATIDIPFQRYYLPLISIVSIWAAYGLRTLMQPLKSVLFNNVIPAKGLPPRKRGVEDTLQ